MLKKVNVLPEPNRWVVQKTAFRVCLEEGGEFPKLVRISSVI